MILSLHSKSSNRKPVESKCESTRRCTAVLNCEQIGRLHEQFKGLARLGLTEGASVTARRGARKTLSQCR